MRYAIFSDVHANETALRAFLADAADARANKLICLGDVVGYGPEPAQTLELVYRKAHVCLAGNHDDAACGRFPVEDFTSVAADAISRHQSSLSASAHDWLSHLPHIHESGDGIFACAHGTFSSQDKFGYVLEPRDAEIQFNLRSEPILFVGHTHKPGIFVRSASGEISELPPTDFKPEPGKRYIVNVGSIGYPRSGSCRSTYCIFDDRDSSVTFRSFPFDIEGYRIKMNGTGMNEAPWIKASAEERARPEVRGAESFAAATPKTCRKSSLKKISRANSQHRQMLKSPTNQAHQPCAIVAETTPAASAAVTKRGGGYSGAIIFGAVLIALAGIWCTVKLIAAVPETHDVSDVKISMVADEHETKPVDVAPTTLGPVIMRARCTVPAIGRRIEYNVKMKKGGAPVWVHLRFEDGNGAPAGDGIWFQNVKVSKRSPKKGVVAPDGATAAFLEIVKAHEGDECSVEKLFLGPYKQ